MDQDARGEAEQLRAYESATLSKPQIVADNVLTGIFLADASYRSALAALLVQEAAEAARRLAAVWGALADRTAPVARRLAEPLPGADAWSALVAAVEAAEAPEELLATLGLDDSARESAEEMLAFEGLDRFVVAIRVCEGGPPAASVERGTPPVLVLRGHSRQGVAEELRLALEDDQVVALADATGDFVTWARELLGAYLDAREGR